MDQTFLDEMKAALTQERDELLTELNSVSHPDVGDHQPGNRDPQFPNYGDDNLGENTNSPLERSDFEVNIEVTQRLSQRLEQVQSALQRFESGTYGKTADGVQIPEDRLRANPAATE